MYEQDSTCVRMRKKLLLWNGEVTKRIGKENSLSCCSLKPLAPEQISGTNPQFLLNPLQNIAELEEFQV